MKGGGGGGGWEQTIFISEMSSNDPSILWTYWPEIE